MEDIIIWIVIVGIAAAVEYLKKKRGSDGTSAGKTSISSPAKPRQRTGAAAPARRAVPAPFIPEPDMPATVTTTPSPAPASRPSRAVAYQPLTASPDPMEEGPSMPETPAAVRNRQHDDTEQARLKAHYDRWRQAIIDTQVLERKF